VLLGILLLGVTFYLTDIKKLVQVILLFHFIANPNMYHKKLTVNQEIDIEKLLSSIISNKEHSHERDLCNAAVILYELNRLGFTIVDLNIDEILNKSKENYSDTIKQHLRNMANSYAILVEGMKNTDISDILIDKVNSIFNR